MNTYVFYPPPFTKTAKVLIRKHRVQQMYRAIQVYKQLGKPTAAWRNHPVMLQWEDYPQALAKYIHDFAKSLGFKAIQAEYKKKAGKGKILYPHWVHNPRYLDWYKGNLKEAFPFTYGKLWEGCEPVEVPCHPVKSRPLSFKIKQKPSKKIVIKGSANPERLEIGGTENAIDTGALLESIKEVKQLMAEAAKCSGS